MISNVFILEKSPGSGQRCMYRRSEDWKTVAIDKRPVRTFLQWPKQVIKERKREYIMLERVISDIERNKSGEGARPGL